MSSIRDWSQDPDDNADSDSHFTARNGMLPSDVPAMGRGIMARMAQYLADNNYRQATLTGTDIIVTLTEDIAELSEGMQIFFFLPDDLSKLVSEGGASAIIPNLTISNLGISKPMITLSYDAASDKTVYIQPNKEMFAPGAPIKAVYSSRSVWTQKAKDAENAASNPSHLKGDTGLLKTDPQWNDQFGKGCWFVFPDTNITAISRVAKGIVSQAVENLFSQVVPSAEIETKQERDVSGYYSLIALPVDGGYRLYAMQPDPSFQELSIIINTDTGLYQDMSSKTTILGLTASPTNPLTEGSSVRFVAAHWEGYSNISQSSAPIWTFDNKEPTVTQENISVPDIKRTYFRVRFEYSDNFFTDWSPYTRYADMQG